MEKIDRLGWAAGGAFVSYGLRIGIQVSSGEIMDRVEGLLRPNAKLANGPRVGCLYSLIVAGTKVGSNIWRFNVLYWNSVPLMRTKDTDLDRRSVEQWLRRCRGGEKGERRWKEGRGGLGSGTARLDPSESSVRRGFLGCRGPLTPPYPSFRFPSLSNGGAEASAAPVEYALSGAFLAH
jgi:hypothetical protein